MKSLSVLCLLLLVSSLRATFLRQNKNVGDVYGKNVGVGAQDQSQYGEPMDKNFGAGGAGYDQDQNGGAGGLPISPDQNGGAGGLPVAPNFQYQQDQNGGAGGLPVSPDQNGGAGGLPVAPNFQYQQDQNGGAGGLPVGPNKNGKSVTPVIPIAPNNLPVAPDVGSGVFAPGYGTVGLVGSGLTGDYGLSNIYNYNPTYGGYRVGSNAIGPFGGYIVRSPYRVQSVHRGNLGYNVRSAPFVRSIRNGGYIVNASPGYYGGSNYIVGAGSNKNVGIGAGKNVGIGAGKNVGIGAGKNVGIGAGKNVGIGAGKNVGAFYVVGAGKNVGNPYLVGAGKPTQQY